MLVVIAIIGATTLIILPAISWLTEHAEKTSAKRNAQMLASVASAAQATGDPIFRNLKSKPALLSYLCSGSSLKDGTGVARVGLSGLSQEETLEASRYLTYNPAAGGLTFTGGNRVNPITDAPEITDPASTPNPEEERNKWNARLLKGAATAAIAVGDTMISTAGSTSAAINLLVYGGVGGSLVANLSSQEQCGAAFYLDYANGTLVYEDN
jgi:type II secretory pathway pseudopilin PulG